MLIITKPNTCIHQPLIRQQQQQQQGTHNCGASIIARLLTITEMEKGTWNWRMTSWWGSARWAHSRPLALVVSTATKGSPPSVSSTSLLASLLRSPPPFFKIFFPLSVMFYFLVLSNCISHVCCFVYVGFLFVFRLLKTGHSTWTVLRP